MHRVIAGCDFLLALYLSFRWSVLAAESGEDALASVLWLPWLAVYGASAPSLRRCCLIT
ncbi:hypothetical protein [Bradyrhizobium sp.]|uniref:hypothetical protein n=1 Tax=Bradyrhizobium sp. TaxID=376 RepID=UPI003C562BA1